MDKKTLERLASAVEKAVSSVGASSYEEGMEVTARVIRLMADGVEAIRTPQKLRETFNQLPPLTFRDRFVLLFIMEHMPQILRYGLKKVAQKAVEDLPALNTGRPASMSAIKREEALDFISGLHRRGVSLDIAKQRAATKYDCSLRTIERYWAARGEGSDDPPSMDEIRNFISTK